MAKDSDGHDYPQITQITQNENLATKRHKKHKMKSSQNQGFIQTDPKSMIFSFEPFVPFCGCCFFSESVKSA